MRILNREHAITNGIPKEIDWISSNDALLAVEIDGAPLVAADRNFISSFKEKVLNIIGIKSANLGMAPYVVEPKFLKKTGVKLLLLLTGGQTMEKIRHVALIVEFDRASHGKVTYWFYWLARRSRRNALAALITKNAINYLLGDAHD